MDVYLARVIGGFTIWIIKLCKTNLKEEIDNHQFLNMAIGSIIMFCSAILLWKIFFDT
jgi:uncharacterized membrane protein YccC